MIRTRFLSTAAALAVLAGALGACDRAQPKAQAAPAAQPVAMAKGKIDVEGGVIRLAAQREGLIQEVFAEEGDRVVKGQVLAQIDSRQAALSVAQARADLSEARARLLAAMSRSSAADRESARLTGLGQVDAVARQEADKAVDEAAVQRGELAAAKAAVEVAAQKLKTQEFEIEARQVRAPLDGRIVRRSAKPGDGASTLNVTELFLLAPDAPRIVRAELDEQFVAAVKSGQRADVLLEYDEKQSFRGHVLRLGEVFGSRKLASDDPNERQDTRVVEMVVAIEDAPGLRIGQRVLVRVMP